MGGGIVLVGWRPDGLDEDHKFVHAAVRAVAQDSRLPAAPPGRAWQLRAAQHEVLTVLAAHLREDPTLATVHRVGTAHRMLVLAELRHLRETFDRAGIEWLLFKGPVLSEVVYRHPGTRTYGDLDVLVRPADVERAVAALEAAGSRSVDAGWRAMLAIGDGESTYARPSGIAVDLHWNVINDRRIRSTFAITTETLFQRSTTVSVDGMSVRTFDPVDTLLHVALHACTSGGDRLRWLLDIQQCLLRCAGRVDEVVDRAAELGLGLILGVMCARVSRFVDESAPLSCYRPRIGTGRLWVAADSLVTRHFPPGSRHEGRISGALMPFSTRSDVARSTRALMGIAPSRLRGRMRERASAGHA